MQSSSIQYRFKFRSLNSPTYYNIARVLQARGWSSTNFHFRAHFSERNFNFDQKAAEALEYKHLLAQLLGSHSFMPESHPIHDENYADVLNEIANKYYKRGSECLDHIDGLFWILKPALLNNGQHIKIFQRLTQVEAHFLSTNRIGGEYVLQRYITDPHLLEGRKYTIRMFVVLTNYANAYLYPKGYFNISLNHYQASNINDLSSHLTNEYLNDDEANVMQIPIRCFISFQPIYKQIKAIVHTTIDALQKQYSEAFTCRKDQNRKDRNLAIFGFDFLIDEKMRVWFLEANHGPCFPVSDEHILQKHLYDEFWDAFVDSFVLPIAQHQRPEHIKYRLFEAI